MNMVRTAPVSGVMTRRQAGRLNDGNEMINGLNGASSHKVRHAEPMMYKFDQTDRNGHMSSNVNRQQDGNKNHRDKDEPTNDEIRKALTEMANIDISNIRPNENLMQLDADDFRKQQQVDSSLQAYWTRAKAGSTDFVIHNDLLYRKAYPNVNTTNEYNLVVPTKFRSELISLAHDNLYGAHTGVNKTRLRLLMHFWWPKLSKMTAEYVKTCHQCQKNARLRTADRLPLQPITLQTHPFDDISFDIAGPTLPKTSRGNRYMLVLVCNVSKYVHAIPLRNLKAKTIVDKLIEWWTITGLPSIIRCDNMPSFKSQLLTAVTQKFGIEMHYSKPFHIKSHGGIKRTIQTLENMIKKCMEKNDKNWDVLLPFLLFAIRESPSMTTGYSPSELVFGRNMRGLLALTRDVWEQNDPVQRELKEPVTKYLSELSKRITTALDVARENTTKAQHKMKCQYDRKSTERNLEVGDQVLILLPTAESKMTAEWQGPFFVTKKLENNNYEIDLGRRKANLHLNSLRRYYPRVNDDKVINQSLVINRVDGDDEDGGTERDDETDTVEDNDGVDQDDMIATDGSKSFQIGTQLTDEQRQQMTELLNEFPMVFHSVPGKTDLIMHKIELIDSTLCWQKPYPIPDALKEETEREINSLLLSLIHI